MSVPRLTVVIPAYNAGKYIRETLNSVLQQKTSFEFEVLVSDDCSTDNTYEICQEYAARFPNFKFIRQPYNLGQGQPNPNLYYVSSYPKTEFIAAIDADDIYTTEDFLERQVKFLDEHPEVSKVFTNIQTFNENGVIDTRFSSDNKPPETFDLHYYFKKIVPICQSSVVFRYSMSHQIPEFCGKYFQCDWLLHIHHGLNGKLGYNDFIGVKYRVHTTNATNQKNSERVLLDAIELVYSIHKFLPREYHQYFTHPRYEMNRLALFYLTKRKWSSFAHWYKKWLSVIEFDKVKWRDQFYMFRQALFYKKLT